MEYRESPAPPSLEDRGLELMMILLPQYKGRVESLNGELRLVLYVLVDLAHQECP